MFVGFNRSLAASVLCGGLFTPAYAQVVLDGSLGPSGALAGPDYAIGAELGKQVGSNLFHSFDHFDVNTGESATFSGPNSVGNIIGRVTGGSLSNIDGLLHSTIPGANLFLLNPAGVMFGPNATLDIGGSFHVSTADYLRFADGQRYESEGTRAPNPVLTSASPAAFGFLGGNPASISVSGSQLFLPADRTLSIIGGSLNINGFSILSAPEGAINLASIASPGEAAIQNLDAGPFSRLGNIAIDQSGMSVNGENGGSIAIRGGQVAITRSIIQAGNIGMGPAGSIDIRARNNLTVADAVIGVGTFSTGSAGIIRLDAPETLIESGSLIDSSARGGSDSGPGGTIIIKGGRLVIDNSLLQTNTFSDARAGDISVDVSRVALRNGAQIDTSACGLGNCVDPSLNKGPGGNLAVTAAEAVSISGRNNNGRQSGLFSNTSSRGDAGALKVSTPRLSMDDGRIVTRTLGGGNGGSLEIRVDDALLVGGAQIFSGIGSIENRNGERIVVGETNGSGIGGNVTISARNSISIAGRSGEGFQSGVFSRAQIGTGNAGDIIVRAAQIAVANGGRIDSDTQTAGGGGTVNILAGNVELSDAGTITANSGGAGNAGDVIIQALEAFRARNASVTTEALTADGGNITIKAPNLVHLRNSRVTASVGEGGNGGNILIDPQFVVLDGASQVVANAVRGSGGDIRIRITDDGAFFRSPESDVRASSEFGVDGSVAIDSPDTDISSSISGLPVSFFDASAFLADRCTRRVAGRASSFVATGRGGVPPGPASLLGASYFADGIEEPVSDSVQRGSEAPSITPSGRSLAAGRVHYQTMTVPPDFWCAR